MPDQQIVVPRAKFLRKFTMQLQEAILVSSKHCFDEGALVWHTYFLVGCTSYLQNLTRRKGTSTKQWGVSVQGEYHDKRREVQDSAKTKRGSKQCISTVWLNIEAAIVILDTSISNKGQCCVKNIPEKDSLIGLKVLVGFLRHGPQCRLV